MERYNLRLNTKKSVFRVTLGEAVRAHRESIGIEIDPDKVKAIQEMPALKIEKEVKKAFDRIKEYLMKPLVLKPLKDGKPLSLYLALEEEAIGAMVAQCMFNDVKHAVYYLSKKLLPYKSKYNLVEKTCLAMIWAIRKLRHHFQSYKVQAISKNRPSEVPI
eukprot:XP_015579169.1 uncharacterized protein LOC107261824 [Ricinus communis]